MPMELAAELGEAWVRHAYYQGYLCTSWGNLLVRLSQQLMGRLPDGICNTVSKNCIPLMLGILSASLLISHPTI